MIEVAVALALLTAPCESPLELKAKEIVAYQCPPPAVQGPPRPPFWWGNIDMKRTVHLAADVPEATPEATPEAAPKEQARVKKKVSKLCGVKTPVWYTKNGKRRYRCK